MSLREDLDTYLAQRRALGFHLKPAEYLLGQFCTWLDAHGKSDAFTIDDAVTWARDRPDAAPVWWSQRLSAVRPFAAWLNASGAGIPIIPAGLLPITTTRRAPYIYSQTDLDRLLDACPILFPTTRVAVTMRTIIGLLAVTGLRIGEALRLRVGDLDVAENVLVVHATKAPLDRLVPLHPSTTTTLVAYLNLPERLATCPSPTGPIFVNNRGGAYVVETIEQHFAALVDHLRLTPAGQRRPRLHDLRHAFCTRHMIAAYTSDADPARTLTLLSTWLGHTDPQHTYWYLSAVPELLAAAAQRLELQGDSQ
ncbi:tyrosine-type recombinase/integrase [Gordonia rhizosphera]|uniref:Putative tyrosine recombinase n=1 Tax=Gordonia rhizosphera NBRC 16068 TaxID=1108045 RepID=K6VC15_9ACTN|nr:tyrosine-type recombinase/integrase [Gordonia rhizosphera]GAB93753.1 putative tyrosine recombinase [Gordonia rhizosphera NBRC 16068]